MGPGFFIFYIPLNIYLNIYLTNYQNHVKILLIILKNSRNCTVFNVLCRINGQRQRGDDAIMKKFKWLILGSVLLLLTTAVALKVSGDPTNSMSSDCYEDGSCCEDENTCTCG